MTYKTREELENCELLPFAADTGLHAVMVGHIAAPNVIGSDTPATLSAELIAMIPDTENTLIVTDSLSMDAITKAYTPGEAAIQAIQAGCDVLLMPNSCRKPTMLSLPRCKTARYPKPALTKASTKSCIINNNLQCRAGLCSARI